MRNAKKIGKTAKETEAAMEKRRMRTRTNAQGKTEKEVAIITQTKMIVTSIIHMCDYTRETGERKIERKKEKEKLRLGLRLSLSRSRRDRDKDGSGRVTTTIQRILTANISAPYMVAICIHALYSMRVCTCVRISTYIYNICMLRACTSMAQVAVRRVDRSERIDRSVF